MDPFCEICSTDVSVEYITEEIGLMGVGGASILFNGLCNGDLNNVTASIGSILSKKIHDVEIWIT